MPAQESVVSWRWPTVKLTPEEIAEARQIRLKQLIDNADKTAAMPERTQSILRGRWLASPPVTYRALATLWKVTPARIQQIEIKALRSLGPRPEWIEERVKCDVCGRCHHSDAAADQCDRRAEKRGLR